MENLIFGIKRKSNFKLFFLKLPTAEPAAVQPTSNDFSVILTGAQNFAYHFHFILYKILNAEFTSGV